MTPSTIIEIASTTNLHRINAVMLWAKLQAAKHTNNLATLYSAIVQTCEKRIEIILLNQ